MASDPVMLAWMVKQLRNGRKQWTRIGSVICTSKVDVVDWARLAPDFRAAVSGDLVPLPVYEILKAGHDQ